MDQAELTLGVSGVAVAVLFAAGVGAGFVNTLAGGAAVVTVPLLMLLGLPAGEANATNRVAVVAQSSAGGIGFARAGRLERGVLAWICLPAVVGAVIGSWAVSLVPDEVLRPLLVVTMVVVAATTLFWRAPQVGDTAVGDPRRPLVIAAMFGAGVYAGLVQAGVGFVLLAILSGVLRYDLVRANALKVVVVAGAQIVSLAVFVLAGTVRWGPGLSLAAGSVLGAHLGVRAAIRRGDRLIRILVFAMALVVAVAVLVRG